MGCHTADGTVAQVQQCMYGKTRARAHTHKATRWRSVLSRGSLTCLRGVPSLPPFLSLFSGSSVLGLFSRSGLVVF